MVHVMQDESNPAREPLGPERCKCGELRNADIEEVPQGEMNRYGWKCETCRWWNWLDVPSPAKELSE